MLYFIKVLDPATGNYMLADDDPYEADSEKEALLKYVYTRKNDPDVAELTVLDDDPASFTVRIKGVVELPYHNGIEMAEEVVEYIADEI